jgi:two-component system sensor kinase
MIENTANDNLNVSLGAKNIGCTSDNQNTNSYKDALKHRSQYLKSSDNSSDVSISGSTINFKDALHAIEQLVQYQKEPKQFLNDIARVYVETLKVDGVCIFESNINGNIKPLAYYTYQSNVQCSMQTLQDIKDHSDLLNPAVLSSIPSMTKALEKDRSVKVWQIPSSEENIRYAISLPLIYDASTICAITLLSTDAQFFSSKRVNMFQIVTYLAASFLINIRQGKALAEKETEQISLQDEIRKLEDKTGSHQRTTDGGFEDAYKELEALSYSISHDLRAPLRAVHSNCEWLNTHYTANLDAGGCRVLQQITASSEYMEKLLDGLLEFSKSVQAELRCSLIDMTALARTVSNELVATERDSSSISISIKPLLKAYGDQTLIHQVWYNLLSNAFKFTQHKQKREVEIDSNQLNGEIIYCVSDNGAGFDMQYADRLFSAFHRLHGIEEFEGTGVGLAIVHRIIKRHGGRVWAEGKIDNGARFYFTIPKKVE